MSCSTKATSPWRSSLAVSFLVCVMSSPTSWRQFSVDQWATVFVVIVPTGAMETPKQGKTLWEMLQARLHGSGGSNGAGIAFDNSLDLRVGSPVAVAYSNGPEFVDYNFTVQEIREYT